MDEVIPGPFRFVLIQPTRLDRRFQRRGWVEIIDEEGTVISGVPRDQAENEVREWVDVKFDCEWKGARR